MTAEQPQDWLDTAIYQYETNIGIADNRLMMGRGDRNDHKEALEACKEDLKVTILTHMNEAEKMAVRKTEHIYARELKYWKNLATNLLQRDELRTAPLPVIVDGLLPDLKDTK